jgi:hypothetical protein
MLLTRRFVGATQHCAATWPANAIKIIANNPSVKNFFFIMVFLRLENIRKIRQVF